MLRLILLLLALDAFAAGPKYEITSGKIRFKSEAPLEVIKAESGRLLGIIDPEKNIFAFRVLIVTFEGFNSELQRSHFDENYMEADHYPEATFTGKIIESVDYTKNGTYSVRAKGLLTIHGVPQERIIKSTITVSGDKLKIDSRFSVYLADHHIKIPRVVHEKIASEIEVVIVAELHKK